MKKILNNFYNEVIIISEVSNRMWLSEGDKRTINIIWKISGRQCYLWVWCCYRMRRQASAIAGDKDYKKDS